MRFLKATIDGNRLAVSDEARAKAVLKKEFGSSDQTSSTSTTPNSRNRRQSTPASYRRRTRYRRADRQTRRSHKLEDYIDLGLLDALKSEGFFDAARK